MTLQVTITSDNGTVWAGSYDDFENANRDALSVAEFTTLWDHGDIDIGGGASHSFHVTLVETDADLGDCPKLR